MLSGIEKEMGENNDAEVEGDGSVEGVRNGCKPGSVALTPLDSLRRKSSKGLGGRRRK